MVALTVVSALAGLLFAVLGSARARARQSACASNLRQLGMAAVLYAHDSDGRFPPFRNTDPGHDCENTGGLSGDGAYCAPAALHDAMMPYVGDPNVWFCPSDPVAGERSNAWYVNHLYSSYRYNFTRTGRLTPDGEHYQAAVSGRWVETPSCQCRVILDPNWMLTSGHVQGWPDGGHHFDGVNVSYADGHVKWVERPRAAP
jgi:prepilin-type processing-associated H-X9-DG protein